MQVLEKLSRQKYKLPALQLFPDIELDWCKCVKTVSSSVQNSPEFLVALSFLIRSGGQMRQLLSFCKITHQSWTSIDTPESRSMLFNDLEIIDGCKLYAVDRNALDYVIVFNLEDSKAVTTEKLVISAVDSGFPQLESFVGLFCVTNLLDQSVKRDLEIFSLADKTIRNFTLSRSLEQVSGRCLGLLCAFSLFFPSSFHHLQLLHCLFFFLPSFPSIDTVILYFALTLSASRVSFSTEDRFSYSVTDNTVLNATLLFTLAEPHRKLAPILLDPQKGALSIDHNSQVVSVMPILSFLSHCFFPDGSRNHPSLSAIGSEVKGSQLLPLDSEEPHSGDKHGSVSSKTLSSWDESVPVISELPSSHGQPMLVDSEVLNSYCNISEIFKYSELEEATNNFDPSRILGKGGYGTVYYGVLKDARPVAIKRLHEYKFKILRLHDEKPEGERLGKFMNEVAILTCMRHENLVQLYGCTSPHRREMLLVQEYIPNGTLAHHLFGKDVFPWSTRLNIAIQTAKALAYLHDSNIIHRDVKTSNILLDKNLNAKVADFGLSRLVPHGVTHITTDPAGTPGYIDPEYYEHCHLSDKSDVYSFGVILIELISSLPAYSEDDIQPYLSDFAMNKIFCGQLQQLVDPGLGFQSDKWINETVSAVTELAFRCLQRQRGMRPSMREVLNTLETIKSGSFKGALIWGPNASYNATKVHIVSRFPDVYFEKK
ncbi:hypothetical protein VNO77_33114 [Canavalia gladiata]|uniref:Protein kinase domain-containing protein n=1 Tax=Canavalia gladiata TaxID=3824 RepID=A0AAN9KD94_CANGL